MSETRPRRWPVAAALGLAGALIGGPARAAEDDGLYGRFEGDLDLRAGAGAQLSQGGGSLAIDVGALYLSSAGIYGHYSDALGGSGPRLQRTLSAGVVIAPIFLARYAKNLEHGPARLDLLLDSLSLQVGSFWSAPRGSGLRATPGLELGLGLGIPILPRASGLFVDLRGGLRFMDEDLPSYLRPSASLGRSAFLTITLGWHQIVQSHLVDAVDRAPR